ncbi:hypothetical protein QJQ45_008800 [Haematococcus lacustris]|nr:hypothetical protein QJQ45_008800 [Haematococcus lacustris]
MNATIIKLPQEPATAGTPGQAPADLQPSHAAAHQTLPHTPPQPQPPPQAQSKLARSIPASVMPPPAKLNHKASHSSRLAAAKQGRSATTPSGPTQHPPPLLLNPQPAAHSPVAPAPTRPPPSKPTNLQPSGSAHPSTLSTPTAPAAPPAAPSPGHPQQVGPGPGSAPGPGPGLGGSHPPQPQPPQPQQPPPQQQQQQQQQLSLIQKLVGQMQQMQKMQQLFHLQLQQLQQQSGQDGRPRPVAKTNLFSIISRQPLQSKTAQLSPPGALTQPHQQPALGVRVRPSQAWGESATQRQQQQLLQEALGQAEQAAPGLPPVGAQAQGHSAALAVPGARRLGLGTLVGQGLPIPGAKVGPSQLTGYKVNPLKHRHQPPQKQQGREEQRQGQQGEEQQKRQGQEALQKQHKQQPQWQRLEMAN